MFKLLLYTTLLSVTVSVSSFAQTSPIETKPQFDQSKIDRLLKKSRNQKITAWSMLGGGTLLVIIGVLSFNGDAYYDYYDPIQGFGYSDNNAADEIFIASGLLSMAGSIPFFILSGKNKKRAKAMVGTTYYPNPAAPIHFKTMPSAGIQITIR